MSSNKSADALTEAVTHTIDTIGRQLDLIAERAPGNILDKVPVVRSLTAHKRRLEKALATVEQHEAAPAGVDALTDQQLVDMWSAGNRAILNGAWLRSAATAMRVAVGKSAPQPEPPAADAICLADRALLKTAIDLAESMGTFNEEKASHLRAIVSSQPEPSIADTADEVAETEYFRRWENEPPAADERAAQMAHDLRCAGVAGTKAGDLLHNAAAMIEELAARAPRTDVAGAWVDEARDKWKIVDGDMREAGDGLITYHVDAFNEGLRLAVTPSAAVAAAHPKME